LKANPSSGGLRKTWHDEEFFMTKFVIVGGAGGVGAAVARALHAGGAELHLIGRDQAKLDAVAGPLGASTGLADVTDAAALQSAITQAGPQIDGLCYAVGTINLKPVHRLTDDDFRRDYEINALGAVRAIQFALPALKATAQANASILLFSTVAVAQGFTGHASISMAKGAIEGLATALAAELAPKIRVNVIAPSLTKTPLAAALTGNEQMATTIAGMHALQRLGEPEDSGSLAAFLMSPSAGWITGQIIGVDGGRSRLRTKG
jgi:NAD(P)-dependent dehydrogenase (short-subunit alcohol dehydrogenase family)